MGFDLGSILSQIGRDKGIDRDVLIEAVESAMLSAARKHYGHNLNLETRFDEDTGRIEVLQFKVVVENVEDRGTEVSLEDAKKQYGAEAELGDEFGHRLDTEVLGRIAAQTAKQVIISKVRDAERGVIYDEYKDSKGDLINAIVQRYDRGNLIVNLGRTEAILPKREQIQAERYRQGDRVRSMILDIDRSARGPQIILTRSHPDFLAKLFELEVPEIAEGVISIKGVAREPGERAKIAVYSSDDTVDPVGACVGIKGSRVHAVVQELRGEKIDIIPWTPDEPSFVARALSPAEVSRVVVEEENGSMEVIVADDQLSYAIGRRGNNVKLASKLTGWKIDVRSISVAEEEAKDARAQLESIPGLQFTHAEMLFQEGYRGPADVANAVADELGELLALDAEETAALIESARNASEQEGSSLESGDEQLSNGTDSEVASSTSEEAVEAGSDLSRLMISGELEQKLLQVGYDSVQSLAVLEDEELSGISGLDEDDVGMLKTALGTLFSSRRESAES